MSPIEARIVRRAVRDLLAAGYLVTTNDGEEDTVRRSSNIAQIMAALCTTEEDYLYVVKPFEPQTASFVWLIWGNEDCVISDYGTSLEEALAGANRLADELCR